MKFIYIMYKKFIIYYLLFSTTLVQAQEMESLRVLSPEQMKEDVLFFYKKIEEIHPNPYCVLDKAQYETKKQELLNSLDKPMNEIEFWLKIGQLNSIYDAHTKIEIPESIISFLLERNSLFFFNGMLKVQNKHFYWNNLEGVPDSLKNREILKINNVSTREIVNNISNYISHESEIIMNLFIGYIYFYLLYPLLYDIPQVLNIDYFDNVTNKNKSIILSMEDFEQWDSVYRQFLGTLKPYSFRFYENDEIAIFELNSFGFFNESEDKKTVYDRYDKDLEKAFDSLNKSNIKHLFVDITRNSGGNSHFGDIFLDYLDVPQKRYSGEITHKISKESREVRGFNSRKSYWKVFSSKFARQMLLTRKGKTFTKKYYHTKEQKPCVYYGNVYLLQSNLTYSAAMGLSSFFKHYNFGSIIGEETSGLTACYIDSYNHKLPHSNFLMFCSMQECIEPGGKWDGRGVLPDIEYKIENPEKSFTLEQLKDMLQLVEEYKKNQ